MGRIEFGSDDARDRLHRLFRHAQVGRSVSSVTHDLNNYLGAIMAYAELVGMDEGLGADSARMLGEVVNAVKKSSALVASLTDVARKEKPDVRVMDPVQLAERVLDLRRYDLRVANIALETRYDDGLPLLSINLPRLQLALMYLISNAIEALDGREKKNLAINVSKTGDGVAIMFADNAGPIADDVQSEMFDPFYTTKGVDHLGLGLTLARIAVEEHGGALDYTPDTAFTLTLPTRTAYAG
ncbi:MAG: HAMP domain-containing histidine kinase [Candidatus Hydrogenedentes bacterium]|nr:HAMP domain-containing histidine kinase [Candidatus Hydrogenedentota bacterium]